MLDKILNYFIGIFNGKLFFVVGFLMSFGAIIRPLSHAILPKVVELDSAITHIGTMATGIGIMVIGIGIDYFSRIIERESKNTVIEEVKD